MKKTVVNQWLLRNLICLCALTVWASPRFAMRMRIPVRLPACLWIFATSLPQKSGLRFEQEALGVPVRGVDWLARTDGSLPRFREYWRKKDRIMIHADALNNAGIDYNAGLERFMGDPELYEMVLGAFLRADIATRARAAYDAHDPDALLKAVHEAKGSGGNAGLHHVYRDADALVRLLRSHDYTGGELTESFLRFEQTYLSAQTAIRTALA